MLFLCSNAAHAPTFSYSIFQSIFPCGERIFHQDYTLPNLPSELNLNWGNVLNVQLLSKNCLRLCYEFSQRQCIGHLEKKAQKKRNGAIKCNVNCGIWMLECVFCQSKCVSPHAYCNEQQWRAGNAELSRSMVKKSHAKQHIKSDDRAKCSHIERDTKYGWKKGTSKKQMLNPHVIKLDRRNN